MILTWDKIIKEVSKLAITIEPFNVDNVTTNSYDLTLSNKFIIYKDAVLDPRKRPEVEEIIIPDWEFYDLKRWEFLLWSSRERIWSNKYVPLIHAKSWIARLWLFVHVTADLIDIWSIGVTTFQFYATLPCRIYPWMKIAQVTFWRTFWEISLYNGKYQWSTWPRSSEVWNDFK